MSHSTLVSMVDAQLIVDKLRIATQTRQSHLKKAGKRDKELENLLIEMQVLERYVDKRIAHLIESHPAYPWFSRINGVGSENIGKVVGLIRIQPDPQHPPKEEGTMNWAHSISALWKYAGFAPGADGTAAKKVKGEKLTYNAKLRSMCWRLGTSINKAGLRHKCTKCGCLWGTEKYQEAINNSGCLGAKVKGRRDEYIGCGSKSFTYIAISELSQIYLNAKEREIRKAIDSGKQIVPADKLPKIDGKKVETDKFISEGHIHNRALRKMIKKFLACYSNDTEVLTDNGWKKFKDIELIDKLATFNTETEHLEYQFPTSVINYHYKGKMMHFKGRNTINFLVTPGHRMLIRSRTKKTNWEFVEAKEFNQESVNEQRLLALAGSIKRPESTIRNWRKGRMAQRRYPNNWEVPKTAKWQGRLMPKFFSLPPAIGKGVENVSSIDMCDWLKFLGLWLADGHAHKPTTYAGGYNVGITKQDSKFKEEIFQLLKQMGFKPYLAHNNKQVVVSSKQLYQYLEPLGKARTKYVPSEFKNLETKALQILLNAYLSCDGSKSLIGGEICYDGFWTMSDKLADDIAEIAIKCGYGVSFSKRHSELNGVYYGEMNTISLSNIHKTSRLNEPTLEDYDDLVWCASVPNGTLLVRRNGKVAFCGNCLWLTWREAEGLPISKPYVFEVLDGHYHYISPEDMVDKPPKVVKRKKRRVKTS